MAKVASMVGVFAASMALFGSVVAMLTGGIGVISGAEEAGSYALRGFWGSLAALAGFAGALTVRSRVRMGASIMGGSTVLGVASATWYYLPGAVLFFLAIFMVLRSDQEDLYSGR